MKNLTQEQKELLEHLRSFIAEHGYSPSSSMIAQVFKTHPGIINRRLRVLVKMGLVSHEYGKIQDWKPIT